MIATTPESEILRVQFEAALKDSEHRAADLDVVCANYEFDFYADSDTQFMWEGFALAHRAMNHMKP